MVDFSGALEEKQPSPDKSDGEAIVQSTIRRLLGEKELLGIKLQAALERANQAERALTNARPYIAFESKLALYFTALLPRFIAIPIRRICALFYALRHS